MLDEGSLVDATIVEKATVGPRKQGTRGGEAELTPAQPAHNRAASTVRALFEHPFAWMGQMGYG